MSDRTYITISIPETSLTPEVIRQLDDLEPSLCSASNGWHVCEYEEVAWGLYNEDVLDLLRWFRHHEVTYRAYDYGYDTWSPYEIAWKPGMSVPHQRTLSTDDNDPVLTATEYRGLRELKRSPIEESERIHAHFSDDPQQWLTALSLNEPTPTGGM